MRMKDRVDARKLVVLLLLTAGYLGLLAHGLRTEFSAPGWLRSQQATPAPTAAPPLQLPTSAPDAGGTVGPSAAQAGEMPAMLRADTRMSLAHADAAMLERIPGIGPVLAERILAYRDAHAPLTSIEQLMAVQGIGEKLCEQLMEHLVP